MNTQCNRCHRPMKGSSAYDGACECGGLIEAGHAKDFTIADHGSITILVPLTRDAEDWAEVSLPEETLRWARGFVIEPRYLPAILEGILADGLTVDCN